MEPRNEFTPKEREISQEDQDYFDNRAIESLIHTFNKVPETEQDTFLLALRNREPIANLFQRHGISWAGPLSNVLSQLENTQAAIARKKNQVLPIEEPLVLKKSDTEGAQQHRGEVMHIQDEINELYRQNNEDITTVTQEEERINEALALLQVFVSGKKGNEKVEVDRTHGGAVEVLFEEDVRAAEELQKLAGDIRDSESRIEKYATDIAELAPAQTPGFLGKIFGSNSPVTEEMDTSRREELEGRKLRTELALAEKEKELKLLQEQFQNKLQEKQKAFSKLLSVTGIDQFSGTVSELVTQLEAGIKTVKESLWAEFEERKERIALLEQQRDELEKSA